MASRARCQTPIRSRTSSVAPRRCGRSSGWSGPSRCSSSRCAPCARRPSASRRRPCRRPSAGLAPLQIVAVAPGESLQVEVISVVVVEVGIEDDLEELRADQAAEDQAQLAALVAGGTAEAVLAVAEPGLVVRFD